MRLLREWTLPVAAPPKQAFASLLRSYTADEYTKVVHEDEAKRELHVEGQAWYHGELTVTAKGKGSVATMRVFSKKAGASRLVWWLPERQGLRFAETQFRDSVAKASQR